MARWRSLAGIVGLPSWRIAEIARVEAGAPPTKRHKMTPPRHERLARWRRYSTQSRKRAATGSLSWMLHRGWREHDHNARRRETRGAAGAAACAQRGRDRGTAGLLPAQSRRGRAEL